MKHKHHDLIVAWANGAEIQEWVSGSWITIGLGGCASWSLCATYRVKPTPKPDVMRQFFFKPPAHGIPGQWYPGCSSEGDNILCQWDGETGKLKTVGIL